VQRHGREANRAAAVLGHPRATVVLQAISPSAVRPARRRALISADECRRLGR
jgi:hypothetical protein